MNIAVIAANGRTGNEFVNVALQNGHKVRAGVFGPHDFNQDENLTIIQCDATNEQDVASLCQDAEVIASFIGHGKKSPATVQTDAIKTAVSIANKLGIERIVSLTGTGVRYPGDKITLIDRVLNMSIAIIDSNRVNDGKSHVKILEGSDLDYTIIRVLKLKNGKPGPFKLTASGPVKTLTSRREVALAALQVIEESSFIRQAPIVAKDK